MRSAPRAAGRRVGSGRVSALAPLCSAPQASQLDDLAQLRIQSDLARQQIIVDDEETAALRLCTHFLDARASAAAEYEYPEDKGLPRLRTGVAWL